MPSRSALKKATPTNDLAMLHLVDIVANMIGGWLLIVSYLKQTGQKVDNDSPVVRSSYFDCISAV